MQTYSFWSPAGFTDIYYDYYHFFWLLLLLVPFFSCALDWFINLNNFIHKHEFRVDFALDDNNGRTFWTRFYYYYYHFLLVFMFLFPAEQFEDETKNWSKQTYAVTTERTNERTKYVTNKKLWLTATISRMHYSLFTHIVGWYSAYMPTAQKNWLRLSSMRTCRRS